MIELYTTQKNENGYLITSNGPGSNSVYWSLSPVEYSKANYLGDFSMMVQVEDHCEGHRVYFHIESDDTGYCVTADRSLFLEGVQNARDMGMYETADGKAFVRPGTFFRCGNLSRPTDTDIEKINELGIKLVFDLRSEDECLKSKDRPISGAKMYEKSANRNLEVTRKQRQEQLSFEEFVLLPVSAHQDEIECTVESYKMIPFGNAAYQEFTRMLLDGLAPCMFHCQAGKDRTGFGEAAILMLLGVPDETILYDYTLTNIYQAARRNAVWDKHITNHPDPEGFSRILEWLFLVRREYLEMSLAEIDRKYSTREEYFEKELGFNADMVADFRSKYLISHI